MAQRRKINPSETKLYFQTIDLEAYMHFSTGEYEKAQQIYLKVLKFLQKEDSFYSNYLTNSSILHMQLGEYEKAA